VRKTKYTREVLAPVVAKARSLSDVIRAFGVKPTGGTHRYFKARIARAGLDTSHFGGRSPFRTMTREQLEPMVRGAKSFAQILRMLSLPEVGRPHHDLKRRVAALGLDTNHFRGSGWSRGETRESHPSVERSIAARSLSDDDAFSATSTVSGKNLKARLLRKGWVYACQICGVFEWHGTPLSLHVDHINGLHYDNRLENLRFLCPNCHSQTPTYCRRNK
jgi:5-methylcytosine-specific restriction endonuclease McrA